MVETGPYFNTPDPSPRPCDVLPLYRPLGNAPPLRLRHSSVASAGNCNLMIPRVWGFALVALEAARIMPAIALGA